jgi:hypothetical protein
MEDITELTNPHMGLSINGGWRISPQKMVGSFHGKSIYLYIYILNIPI